MSKKKSWVALIIATIVVLASVYAAVFGFGPTGSGSAANIVLGLDLKGGVSVTYQVQDESFTSEELSDTIYKLQQRVAEYSTDATVYQEGSDQITVEIPGVYDTETIIEELGRPGSVEFITYDTNDDDETEETVWITGEDIEDAQAATRTDSTTGEIEYIVQLTLTDEGTEKFSEATASHVDDIIYIVYDDEVVSSPTVQSEITSSTCEITGLESYEEASTLASTIRIGSLSLELEEISSKVVSAKMGDNAVTTSLIAGIIGLLLIMIFMIIYYRVPGVCAAISLVFYAAAMLVAINAFDLTLTISGIAGIILSIGMAVDGNVIINTRIREELREGQPVDQAIRLGYRKSVSAILDGNITTLIVAIVLIIVGTGSVNGFGYTLSIGIVLSVITSLFVSRLFISAFHGIGLKKKTSYAPEKIKKAKIRDFIGKRVIWFCIAGVCIVAGIVAMIANGVSGNNALNFSIEFVGGVSTTVDFEEDYSIDEFNDEIKSAIAEIIDSTDIEGQKVTGSNEYVIKTPELSQETITELKDMLVADYGADEDSFEITKITGVVSSELQKNAIISLLIATACMLIYIWIRFRRFKYAGSSVIALLHDVMIVVSFYAIFRLSVGSSFIACILTIVGYSINATIIVFDRIRENSRDPFLNYDFKRVINASISQTLTRTLFTSATTFVVVLFLYILGVESMRAFALPLAVGIVAGAFSSIFISGNLVYTFTSKAKRYDEKAARIAEKRAENLGVDIDSASGASDEEISEAAKAKADAAAKITANPNHKKKKRKQ